MMLLMDDERKKRTSGRTSAGVQKRQRMASKMQSRGSKTMLHVKSAVHAPNGVERALPAVHIQEAVLHCRRLGSRLWFLVGAVLGDHVDLILDVEEGRLLHERPSCQDLLSIKRARRSRADSRCGVRRFLTPRPSSTHRRRGKRVYRNDARTLGGRLLDLVQVVS